MRIYEKIMSQRNNATLGAENNSTFSRCELAKRDRSLLGWNITAVSARHASDLGIVEELRA